ncbi:CAP domain-containing protein [Alteribacter natronophilus]|uniref:CAP domain-containing protein n=1 Tax=Alteribacter natronophilus TaxID=2583810 RepID=UPI00110F4D4C|nr:CAP domain-containing protein [Alteribacter natronophilus]TMW73096.1 hypothetical protein FGB90_01945 [Alteribacter natronophilus]
MRIALKLAFIAFGLGLIAYMFSLDDQAQEDMMEELPVLGDGVSPDEEDQSGNEPSAGDDNLPSEEENDGNADMDETENGPGEEVSSGSSTEENGDNGGDETEDISDTEVSEGYHTYIGETAEVLTDAYGDPDRTDMTQYGYEWYVWNEDHYLQAGVSEGEVVSLYTNMYSDLLSPFTVGEPYEELKADQGFEEEVSLTGDFSTFTFNLSESDVKTRPLVEYDGVYVQLYFDTFDGTLSSVRYSDEETLVLHQPYSLTYSRSMPEKPELSDGEWEAVEEGMARQVFDLTNNFRKRHGIEELEWHEDTAQVALGHSRDMYENEYFSHSSPAHGELSDRLTAEGVQYHMAAENIAARYDDAAAAVEGWLNSEGHRVNLKHEDLTHLGVGVYREFYTQNFITPW